MTKALGILAGGALALAACAAMADPTSIFNWNDLTGQDYSQDVGVAKGGFVDAFNFYTTSVTDLTSWATSFETHTLGIQGAEVTLYEGTYGSGASLHGYTKVGQYSFGGQTTSQVIGDLASGHYFFALTGTGSAKGGLLEFEGQALPVPEPTTTAMFLAGLGMLAFMGRRRNRG